MHVSLQHRWLRPGKLPPKAACQVAGSFRPRACPAFGSGSILTRRLIRAPTTRLLIATNRVGALVMTWAAAASVPACASATGVRARWQILDLKAFKTSFRKGPPSKSTTFTAMCMNHVVHRACNVAPLECRQAELRKHCPGGIDGRRAELLPTTLSNPFASGHIVWGIRAQTVP